jgi:hypothetical protein
MKRERRHELQHNDLAEWILNAYERIAPYKNAILGVGLLAVVLLIGMSLWHSYSVAQAGEAWNSLGLPLIRPDFANEQTFSAMQRTIQTYPGTPAAQWADVFAGDTALMIGTNKILTDKKVGILFLTQARDRYTEALKTLTIPGAVEQAMFGKARAMESLIENKAQVDEALAAYQELNKRFPEGMFKAVAEQQIGRLQKKETLTFYEALAQYAPKPKVESPASQLGKLGPLSENPPEEPAAPKPSVRGGGIPEPSLTPKEPVRPATPKTAPAKPQTAKSDVPKPAAPTPETPKKDK